MSLKLSILVWYDNLSESKFFYCQNKSKIPQIFNKEAHFVYKVTLREQYLSFTVSWVETYIWTKLIYFEVF